MKQTTLNGQSTDIVSDNIQKLKQIFPEVFCEDSIDFEKLKAVLGDYTDDDNERYNFTWWGKSKALRLAQTPSMGTLRPCKEESKDWDTTGNLYIEGDNLEVLKLLQKSYHGKIKMIYIDPPYNTGKDFVYPDDYRDGVKNYKEITGQVDAEGKNLSTNSETSGRYHTNWLNMMYPRLRLARNLLQDDGVIFISIDEMEVANVKKLCDEIFGEVNFVECIAWNKRIPKNDKGVGNIHEYILLYIKNSEINSSFTMRKDGLEEIFQLVDKFKKNETPLFEAEKEIRKLYKKNSYDRGITLYNSIDENYKLWGKINMSWPNANTFGPTYEVLHPITHKPVKIPDRGWRWKRETFDEASMFINGSYKSIKMLHDGSVVCGRIWFAQDESTQPSSIIFLDEVNTFLLRSILSLKSDGGIEVENLFEGKSFFPYPKPTKLIKILIDSNQTNNGDLILDFFAGSSTTANAVLQLNVEDGGKRKFIMVQLPEVIEENSEVYKSGYKTICDIGKERIRRAGEKIKAELLEKQKEQPSLLDEEKSVNPDDLDIGFKVFKLDSSNLKKWNPDHAKMEESLLDAIENFVDDRSELDVVYEIMLKYGIDLTLPLDEYEIGGKKIYSIGYGALMICLNNEITTDVANEIVRLKGELEPEIIRVVFKDNGFEDDSAKTNTREILRNAGIDEIVTV